MAEEAVYVGVDVAKNILDLAVSNSKEARQFKNDHKGITDAVSYIASLKPAKIILEATGKYEIPLAAELQANRLPVVIVNPRQVRDFARATGVLAKTDRIDAITLIEVIFIAVMHNTISEIIWVLLWGNLLILLTNLGYLVFKRSWRSNIESRTT
ncbi:MAG: transposase [Thermodesulfobacteriota bacterium]